jgi:hypothetical protein
MPWEEGKSGNPEGRPKYVKPWKEAIQRAIKRREDSDPHALDKLADKLLTKVEEGDVSAIKELGDRLDGKVPQAIGGADDLPPVSVIVTGVPRAGRD